MKVGDMLVKSSYLIVSIFDTSSHVAQPAKINNSTASDTVSIL